jgi:hypothetical protein
VPKRETAFLSFDSKPSVSTSSIAKVSHTLTVALARRLAEFAFYERFSESAVLEYALAHFFELSVDDDQLADMLRRAGLGLRRRIEPLTKTAH